MQAYDAMVAFGFRVSRAALDGPMMRLGDRSAPLPAGIALRERPPHPHQLARAVE